MPTMYESLDAFSSRLLQIKGSLDVQKDFFAHAEQTVFDILEKSARDFSSHPTSGDGTENNTLRLATQKVSQQLTAGILHWKEEMQSRSKVRQTLEEMGAGLIVVVFGRTNAGKSTLGNFLRGRQLRKAAFANAWKDNSFPLTPIRIIEKGKDSESEDSDEWFREGATETTREAQLFQLPGLLWLDTPGFGSTNDDTLGELARKYVKRADLIIYLEHSDNPGLRAIMQKLLDVLQDGRCALIAINQSDKNDYVLENGKRIYNADGEPLQKRVAKSVEDRQKQENYLVGILRDNLPNKEVNAVSISMLLAKEAVENDDNEQYQHSNINALFDQILNLIKDDSGFLHLKNRDAQQNCISLINNILGIREMSEINLKILDADLARWEAKIQDANHAFNIEDETRSITAPILLKASGKLRELLRTAEAESSTKQDERTPGSFAGMLFGAVANGSAGSGRAATSHRVDINSITKDIGPAALHGVQEKAKHLLKDLFDSASVIARSFPAIAPATLERKQEKRVYEVTETESYERSPDGIIEHVCSWFGKQYYGSRLVTMEEEQIIDLGFNVEETFAKLNKSIESVLTDYVRQELESIRQGCLVHGLEMVRNCRKVLAGAKSELEQLRQNLEQKCNTGESHT